MTPMRSISRAGLRGSSLGVECPLGGEEEAKEEAVAEAVMEAPWWCIRARLRPSRLTLATRFSISSARSSVDSFSSWISLGRGERGTWEEKSGVSSSHIFFSRLYCQASMISVSLLQSLTLSMEVFGGGYLQISLTNSVKHLQCEAN